MQKNLTIKDLPDTEKPYEKCIAHGAGSLSDAELIAAVIRTGVPGEQSIDVARRILRASDDGILNIVYLSMQELRQIKGIGKVKAVQLKCIAELAKRISMARRYQRIVLDQPSTIAGYYMERLRHEPKENLLLSMYNGRSMLIKDLILTVGTTNSSLVSPAEIFRKALEYGAEYIVLLHNHPSGDPHPSEEDCHVTERISACGQMLGIVLMDHIIIGDNQYYSFRENNQLH